MNPTARAPFGIIVLSILMLAAAAVPTHATRRPEDNSATRSSDGKVVLSSEDVAARWPWMTNAVAAATAACHSTTTCGSAYPSCASWSAYYDCGDPFCSIAANCGDPDCTVGPSLCGGPATRQKQERFRVCFDAQSNSCTEYQTSLTLVLGCGC